jgi:hypothetical protein
MFFPWVGFFEQLRLADSFVYYDDVQFSKGSFTNRVQVWNGTKVDWLSVPTLKQSLQQNITDVAIDQSKNWRRKHLEKLQQSYARAPYCDEMIDLVSIVYGQNQSHISTLSINSIETVCRYFGIATNTTILKSSELQIGGHSSQRVLDIVKHLNGDTYITGHGAKNYLQHNIFEEQQVKVRYMDYQKLAYQQLSPIFTPYISILDLIANCGAQGKQYICSPAQYWKEFFK